MDMGEITNQMVVLLILMVIGYGAAKAGILNKSANEMLTKIVVYIALPALILSAMTGIGDVSLHEAGSIILASSIFYIVSILVALLITKTLRVKREDKSAYRFIMSFGNVAFMGYPVISAVFGPEAMFYCALYNVPFNVFVYSVGTMMLIKGAGGGKLDIKKIVNPPLVTALVGLLLFLMNIELPAVIADCAETLGDATTPMAMLILGSALAQVPIRELFTEWRIYVVSLYKLIAMPVLTWLVASLFLTPDSMVLKTAVLLAAMPIATNATMMTIQFGGNQTIAAKGVFFTTVLCVVTIPLTVYFFFS